MRSTQANRAVEARDSEGCSCAENGNLMEAASGPENMVEDWALLRSAALRRRMLSFEPPALSELALTRFCLQ
eukprot:1464526-Pleurochrysis_carterae.AAC.1